MPSAVGRLWILTEKAKKRAQPDSAALRDAGWWRLRWSGGGGGGIGQLETAPRWKSPNGSPVVSRGVGTHGVAHQSGIIHADAICVSFSFGPNGTCSAAAAAAAVGNCGVLNCQNDTRHWKQAKSGERFSPAEGTKTEVCLAPGHNQDGYSWGPSSLQSEGWCLWRWLRARSCQPAAAVDTVGQESQTARLLSPSPFKSSSLQPSAWSLTWSITCWSGGRQPQSRLAACPLPPCFLVLGFSPSRSPVCSGPLCLRSLLPWSRDLLSSSWFQRERSSLLDRRVWRRFDSPVCPTVQWKPSRQIYIQRKKQHHRPRRLLLPLFLC